MHLITDTVHDQQEDHRLHTITALSIITHLGHNTSGQQCITACCNILCLLTDGCLATRASIVVVFDIHVIHPDPPPPGPVKLQTELHFHC